MFNYRNIFDNEGLTYPKYRELVDELLADGKTTGTDHSQELLHYTRMNVQRMKRVEKTTILNDEMLSAINEVKQHYRFLVISEGWCGDAAQIVPVMDKIVSAAPEKFSFRLILRDQHLALMDQHLTNGARAIPVVLVLDEEGELVLPKWGPRPVVLQSLRNQWKAEGADSVKIGELLHGWYAKDKTQETQRELTALLLKLH